MRIGHGPYPHVFWSFIRAIPLRKADEEALLRGKAVYGLKIFTPGSILQGDVGKDLTAQVSNILSERELRVDVYLVHDDVLRILILNALGALLKFLRVFFGPPILKIALGVELAALIVKAVRQLVANGPARIAVIRSVVELGVIERRLQHAGREVDVIHLRVVVGVDRRWRHAPLSPIYGLTDFVYVAVRFKLSCVFYVAEKVIARDLDRAVIAPFIRISDLVANAVELQQSLFPGRWAHPVKLFNAQLHRVLDAFDHVHRAGLEFR